MLTAAKPINSSTGERRFYCRGCGYTVAGPTANRWHECHAPPTPLCGPGCQLRRTLSWFVRDDGQCGCTEFAAQMDAWGPAESFRRLEEVVEHLRGAAAAKGLPFIATAARMLVARAIEAAEKEHANATTNGHGPHRQEAVEDPRL